MLARVAESLYWMGRNIERVEHCSRFLKVQYYSTLDAPMSQNKDFTLRSILFMSGAEMDFKTPINENYILFRVILDPNNTNSLFSLIKNVRENARSIRNNLSSELWEAINKCFLYLKDLTKTAFTSSHISTFSDNISIHIALIKSSIATTLLHNDIWGFINLGMYLERSLQVLRILRSKISDSIILSNNGVNKPLLQYQWTTLLKSLEAFDVYRYQYRGILSKETIFELVLEKDSFSRSLKYSIQKVKNHISRISVRPDSYQSVMDKFEQTMRDCIHFSDYTEDEDVLQKIREASECLSDLHYDIEELYFK
ncbi:MAG: alpha-E domain-containing protein [Bacteroidota bacterium]